MTKHNSLDSDSDRQAVAEPEKRSGSIEENLPAGLTLGTYNDALRAIDAWERTGEYDWELVFKLFELFHGRWFC